MSHHCRSIEVYYEIIHGTMKRFYLLKMLDVASKCATLHS